MKKIISIALLILLTFANASVAVAKSALLYCDTVVLESVSEHSREEILDIVVKDAKGKTPAVDSTVKEEKTESAPTLKDFFNSFS